MWALLIERERGALVDRIESLMMGFLSLQREDGSSPLSSAAGAEEEKGVMLFGVRLSPGAGAGGCIRKSVSLGNLALYTSHPREFHSRPEHLELSGFAPAPAAQGYVSDGMVQSANGSRERKKGVPWTEDEHKMFLVGLEKLGKGDWRGISRNFVTTRTPTQVASHAQKYFLRQNNLNKRKRRSSLFDISTDCSSTSTVPSTMIEGFQNPFMEIDMPSNLDLYPSRRACPLLDLSPDLYLGSPPHLFTPSLRDGHKVIADGVKEKAMQKQWGEDKFILSGPSVIAAPSSLAKIDEESQIPSCLSLSIGPPSLSPSPLSSSSSTSSSSSSGVEPNPLSIKQEQPVASASRLSAFHAATPPMRSNGSAIRVV